MEDTQTITDAPVNEWQVKAEEYLNNWKRSEANFVNYKKDEDRRMKEVTDFAKKMALMDVIEVKDDLEEALKREKPNEKSAFLDGIVMTLKKFNDILAKNDISRVETTGQLFNPEYHEAVQVEGEGADRIVEEIRAGYLVGGRVLRPARVKISK